MTQEDKQLLLRDLCARLPYRVICQMEDELIISDSHFYDCNLSERYIELFRNHKDFYIKPYLRPLSSMKEGEKKELLNHVLGGEGVEYFHIAHDGSIDGNQKAEQDLYNLNLHWINFGPLTTSSYIDWLNAHHFDYRGLIERNLAIDCSKLNIYD